MQDAAAMIDDIEDDDDLTFDFNSCEKDGRDQSHAGRGYVGAIIRLSRRAIGTVYLIQSVRIRSLPNTSWPC